MINFEDSFSPDEKKALSLLTDSGFKAFAEAKIEDCRNLDGSRRRTFTNAGRYDLVLALKMADHVKVETSPEKKKPVEPVENEKPVKKTAAKKPAARKSRSKTAPKRFKP